ncbi:Coiled-coil domain-containing protein 93 [Aphanomyces cochlioides]|nr:Coiled-coil domain-containing protein 93 [Aphanomyces cochlioides]
MTDVVRRVVKPVKTGTSESSFIESWGTLIRQVLDFVISGWSDRDISGGSVDTLDSKYQLLLEKQQAYVAAIREFQKECEKNTKLANHLESLRQ